MPEIYGLTIHTDRRYSVDFRDGDLFGRVEISYGSKTRLLRTGAARYPAEFKARFEDLRRDGRDLPVGILMRFAGSDVGPECAELTVTPASPGNRITSEALRAIPVATFTRLARIVAARGPSEELGRADLASWAAEVAEPGPSPGGRGRRLPDEHYAEVARVYREALAAGDPPTKAVALIVARDVRKRAVAARWVAEARRRGLLGPTDRGRKGEKP